MNKIKGNVNLEVKEDGQIWLIPNCPEYPKSVLRGENSDKFKEYETALASAERYLCADQWYAQHLLSTILPSPKELKPGIYPIPDLKWHTHFATKDVKDNGDFTIKKVVVISLPEPKTNEEHLDGLLNTVDKLDKLLSAKSESKSERKKLLIEMMQEDEKHGMYEDSAKNAHTDNELIAEFMGMIPNPNDGGKMWSWPEDIHSAEGQVYGDWHFLKYDTSWDWLMPVVEKIESLGFTFVIDNNEANIFSDEDCDKGLILKQYPKKIQSVYKAVVQFIKWYNQQSK